jgi:gamma-glutamyltranspeptidase
MTFTTRPELSGTSAWWRRPAGSPRPRGCGQGPAPAATIEAYRSQGFELVPGTGPLAACVPGAFDAWMLLLRGVGTLEVADVFANAIGYARDGFPAVPGIVRSIRALVVDDWSLGRLSAVSRAPDGLPRAGANPRGTQSYAVGR